MSQLFLNIVSLFRQVQSDETCHNAIQRISCIDECGYDETMENGSYSFKRKTLFVSAATFVNTMSGI